MTCGSVGEEKVCDSVFMIWSGNDAANQGRKAFSCRFETI